MLCRARIQADEYHCPDCRLRWGISDPEPPECPLAKQEPPPPATKERSPCPTALRLRTRARRR